MKETVLAFVNRINAHDVNGIINLMAEDYKFVNSAGDTFHGRELMRATWEEHFRQYPDFRIRIQRVVADENAVAVFGISQGTYSPDGNLEEDNHWEIPAAFLGTARDDQMIFWQTWSDTTWVFDVLQANEGDQPQPHITDFFDED